MVTYIMTRDLAIEIRDNNTRNEKYMRNLVARVTGDRTRVNSLNYPELLDEVLGIRRMAWNMLRDLEDEEISKRISCKTIFFTIKLASL